MRLASGSKLGTYEVISLLGTGGMGEVYRARDTRLGRDVAIKVLPADRLADEDRRRRFVQEAQAASALNHPHIITIHEIESAYGHDFTVMEYVPGKSLDALIPRQGMRLAEVLRIAIPVADAVAAAHARGIIHRDLKPANVIVGTDGAVKVLDFGLAKLTAHDAEPEEQTVTHVVDPTLSVPGTIAGTAAYMSPEQATGGKVDARSDLFAFGAMLYEMVTGTRAFPGGSTAETLNAVLRAEPKRPSAVITGVPLDLEKIILRCLRKDPARRFQHIDDVNVALHEIKEESGTAVDGPVPSKRRGRLLAALAGIGVLICGAAAWRLWPHGLRDTPPQIVPLTTLPGQESSPSFSPDGSQIAFVWGGEKDDNTDIYVKIIGSSEVRRLTSHPAPDFNPSWSPDGRLIAFVRERPEGNTIQLVSPLGGSERKLSDFRSASSITWSPDGRWMAVGRNQPAQDTTGDAGGIYLVPVQGGERRAIVRFKPRTFDYLREPAPAFSPDGRRLAYVSCPGCNLYVVDLDAALAPTAPPRRLPTQAVWGIGSLAWTRDGNSVVYVSGNPNFLWRVEVNGYSQPKRVEIAGLGANWPSTALSQDRLAFARVTFDTDIYRFTAGHPPRSVAASTFPEFEARWSPDGRRIAFTSLRSGERNEIWVAEADGSGVRQLTHGPGPTGSPWWSPDGRRIAFDSITNHHSHIWLIDADGGTPHQLTTDAGDQTVPTWSHDGQWIYFSADHGTGRDIWRVPATGGPSQRVTREGSGLFACESPDGKSLLYQPKDADSPLLALPLSEGPPRQLVACVKPSAFATGPQGVYYVACDSSPDPALHVLDPKTGQDRLLGRLEQYENDRNVLPLGLAVSPDGMSVLYLRHMSDTSDLMLIENFR